MATANGKAIRSYGELGVWESAQFPDGVFAEKRTYADVFEGTREALIAGGHARPEWFPLAPMPGKRAGTVKRVFGFDSPTGPIKLVDLVNGKWQVRLPVPEQEEKRRMAEWDAQRARDAAARGRREELTPERRKAAARSLLEMALSYLLDDERDRRAVMKCAEDLLAAQPMVQPTARGHLRLVVDNDRAPQ